MLKKICLIVFVFAFINDFVSSKEYSIGSSTEKLLDYGKAVVFDFGDDVFEVTAKSSYCLDNIEKFVYNQKNNISVKLDIFAENLRIIKKTSILYALEFTSLGEKQVFLFNTATLTLEKLFQDMVREIDSSIVDYENKVIIGNTRFTGKGLAKEQVIELYLFSTAKQKHYKIAERHGDLFSIKKLEGTKFEYNIETGEKIIFDYSDYIIKPEPDIWEEIAGLEKSKSLKRTYTDCTSFLTEQTKSYPVENLCNLADSTPWVENVPGDGIGEGFVIKNSWGKVYPTLLIMNGYISKEKSYLYKQNNRIKKIKVTGVKSGKSKVLDVLDTPHPQTVDISFITEAEDLRVEIADVYKGTKYDDTCIHFMITWDTEVIPYETSVE